VSHNGDGAGACVNYGDGVEQVHNAAMTTAAAVAAATIQCSCTVILQSIERSIDPSIATSRLQCVKMSVLKTK